MLDLNPQFELNPFFTGRESELKWLEETTDRLGHWFSPIVVHGPVGVGKTTLLKHFIAESRLVRSRHYSHAWIDLSLSSDPPKKIDDFIEQILSDRNQNLDRLLVILDGAESLNDKEIKETVNRVFNWKIVRGMLIASRRRFAIDRSESLELGPLNLEESKSLLQSSLELSIDSTVLAQLAQSVNGYPLAIRVLSELVKRNDPSEIAQLLTGNYYDLSEFSNESSSEIITIAKPVIISASEKLVRDLQKRPEDLLNLSPRDFEKMLAELLIDMGFEVELTKATRDGGMDILAYMNTGAARFLCLVEAKRYRPDRKIGVDLVRTLYGTFCDYQANSAMMVTTSSFTRDARQFQKKHEYQLKLRDHADVLNWITKFKK